MKIKIIVLLLSFLAPVLSAKEDSPKVEPNLIETTVVDEGKKKNVENSDLVEHKSELKPNIIVDLNRVGEGEKVELEKTPSECEEGKKTIFNGRKFGILFDLYIKKNLELDTDLVCNHIFPLMTPEQINESLNDIRKFTEEYERAGVKSDLRGDQKIGEFFLANILHSFGYVVTFIENAWVDIKSKAVFVEENYEDVENAIPLEEYWDFLSKRDGLKINTDKLYASCIDYLTVMLGVHLSEPCLDWDHLSEVEDRWIYWMEKVTRKLDGNEIFGGYYNEYLSIFREVFYLWKVDFENKEAELEKIREEEEEAVFENSFLMGEYE